MDEINALRDLLLEREGANMRLFLFLLNVLQNRAQIMKKHGTVVTIDEESDENKRRSSV
jgi:hypothetical protein